ncbi:oxidoreductase [Verrucomicrobia bacterium LW23]|nr:oxidoreductase [Verrucomicrobia bacterium LW23]
MSKSDGMNYAPKGKPSPVVKPGEFVFAATALDHGHINGQCNGLSEAGGELRWVYDPDPKKVEAFQKNFPGVKVAPNLETILDDADVKLVAAAAIPNLRGPLGIRVMESGKDYFTDKTPFTSLEQLDAAKVAVEKTGKKYAVYFSERLHVECAMYAGDLVHSGAIGKVVNVIGMGPHRLGAAGRPSWFFNKEQYGGILTDIGSHQIEQFLHYSGATDAEVISATVGNFANPEHPELEDFGQASLLGNNGATSHYRVDWFTPAGLGTWGDGRTFILGTKGYIELRKYIDVARDGEGNQLYLITDEGTQHMSLTGKVGYPYFGQLILDCLNRTENAMTQAHAFKAAELCIRCQLVAEATAKATAGA